MPDKEIDYKSLSEQLAGRLFELQTQKEKAITFRDKEHTAQIGMDNSYKILFVEPHDSLLYAGEDSYEIGTTRPTHRIIAISKELDDVKSAQVLAHELTHALIHETLIESPEYFSEEQVAKMFQMWNKFIYETIKKVVV